MNNSQFRRLIKDTSGTASTSNGRDTGGQSRSGPGATPTALGSRMRANIPMTPRSVASNTGIDFARQLAERNASLQPDSVKKFRSSAAPKGSKLGSGYQDRTQSRTSTEEDEKASRVKALEELVKLGQMERSTFEALRDEIVGGDVKDVHLVKGLDWKLLERVRKGEDVLSDAAKSPQAAAVPPAEIPSAASAEDVDEELEKLGEKEYQAKERQATMKKGDMAPPPPVAGKKRTRDEILKELKASRQAAADKALEARQPALGPKFHKVGHQKATSRIEKDDKGRDVLITIDADGNVKRKVKKTKTEAVRDTSGLLMPDKDVKPLGLDITVPSTPSAPEEQDDGDIFADVQGDYNPLGGELDHDEPTDESDPEDKPSGKATRTSTERSPTTTATATPLPRPPAAAVAGPRNYFNDPSPSTNIASDPTPPPGLQDPTILAALKKASTLDPFAEGDHLPPEEQAKLARRKKMLEAHDRDAEDMDMGFGSSRFEDEADDAGDGKKVRLSVWGGGEGEKGGEGGERKEKRKRGPKKGKKGDKDSVKDVMHVMESRKGEGRR
ncbi:hypothetical protein XANCAGTX0491_001127 [Xanthoria calcicola]